jgi:hypothetical protein
VLVAWRSRRTTAIRVLAPFLFLLLALVVNLALNANNALQERFVATPAAAPFSIGGIPSCHEDLHIGASKPCIDFVYSPNNDTTINVSSSVLRTCMHSCCASSRAVAVSAHARCTCAGTNGEMLVVICSSGLHI